MNAILARRVRVGGHRAGAVRVGQAGGELGLGALCDRRGGECPTSRDANQDQSGTI